MIEAVIILRAVIFLFIPLEFKSFCAKFYVILRVGTRAATCRDRVL